MFYTAMFISLFCGGWMANSLVTGKEPSKKEKNIIGTAFMVSTAAALIFVI